KRPKAARAGRYGPPVVSKRLPASAKHNAIDSDSNPTAMNASGPHGPICLATSDGSRKIALPITWLTPIAVRSHLPSARLSAGASGPAIGLFPSGDHFLDSRRQRIGGERLHQQV